MQAWGPTVGGKNGVEDQRQRRRRDGTAKTADELSRSALRHAALMLRLVGTLAYCSAGDMHWCGSCCCCRRRWYTHPCYRPVQWPRYSSRSGVCLCVRTITFWLNDLFSFTYTPVVGTIAPEHVYYALFVEMYVHSLSYVIQTTAHNWCITISCWMCWLMNTTPVNCRYFINTTGYRC